MENQEQPTSGDAAGNPDLENRFTYQDCTVENLEKQAIFRNKGKELAYAMTALAPASRELSLAITNLEQSIMWVNAAIARHG